MFSQFALSRAHTRTPREELPGICSFKPIGDVLVDRCLGKGAGEQALVVSFGLRASDSPTLIAHMPRNNTRMEARLENQEAQVTQIKQHQLEMNQVLVEMTRQQLEEFKREFRASRSRNDAEPDSTPTSQMNGRVIQTKLRLPIFILEHQNLVSQGFQVRILDSGLSMA